MKRIRNGLGAVIAALMLLVPQLMAQVSEGGPPAAAWWNKNPGGIYIVTLKEPPAVAYDGGVSGLKATRPAAGKKLDTRSGAVRRYVAYLQSRHDQLLAAVGAGRTSKVYDYYYVLNGFAAQLNKAQVAALRAHPDVLAVLDDEFRVKATDNTPDFLGLTDLSGGLWADHGLLGEDVIIGVIDSGVWPENPAFSDQDDFAFRPGSSGKGSLAYGPPPSYWNGVCQAGENWSQDHCNNKLIGARYFVDGFGKHAFGAPGGPGDGIVASEFLSPRDADGHGSHTASTAGGNDLSGTPIGTSGMAPRARIAVYKTLWNGTLGGGFTSDMAAAIDTAVADGVDVINYSIGSFSTSFLGADDIAFLFAADAGVVAVAAAGNEGPGPGTIGSPAVDPWITSVGASRDDSQTGVILDENAPNAADAFDGIEGTSPTRVADVGPVTGNLIPADPLDGCTAFGNAGAYTGTEIALVIRGTCTFAAKTANAAAAGATGIVVYNDGTAPDRIAPITMSGITTALPGMMISFTDGEALNTLAGGTTVNVSMVSVPAGDHVASFSSRGPNLGAPDVIKPDVAAPGVNILAANTEAPLPFDGNAGEPFHLLSGTSMAAPHVAGVAALLIEHQRQNGITTWGSPATIRSALMTTARQNLFKEGLALPIAADPFDIGAGHIEPNAAIDPGLVYDAGFLDYLAFLCGSSSAVGQSTCDLLAGLGFSFDASDVNLPSVAIAELTGFQTITRTVTNVTGSEATFEVDTSNAPPGILMTVTPTSITLPDGGSAEYEVEFTYGSGNFGEWRFGSLTWDDSGDGGSHLVYSPVAIRPLGLAAPAEVSGACAPGDPDAPIAIEYDVSYGYSGDFDVLPHGLDPAAEIADTVADDPANQFVAGGPGVTSHDFAIPSGIELARFALFDEDTDGDDDLDLFVLSGECPGTGLLALSGSPTSDETVDLVAPAAGDYCVAVHGFATDGPDSNYTLSSWMLDDGAVSNMSASDPGNAVIGGSDTITLNVDCDELSSGRYLGAATHHNVDPAGGFNDSLIDFTVVRVDK